MQELRDRIPRPLPKGWLNTEEGRQALEQVKAMPWKDLIDFLGSSQRVIQTALAYHKIKRPRPDLFQCDEVIRDIIRRAYRRSREVPKEQLPDLREEVVRKVNERCRKVGFSVKTWTAVRMIATDMKNKGEDLGWGNSQAKKTKKRDVEPPRLIEPKWQDPPELQISLEAWRKPGVRVGAISRIEWEDAGARYGLIQLAWERVFVPRACHYIVLNGGLVSKRSVEGRIKEELAKLTPQQRKLFREAVEEHVRREMASELFSIIPRIRKPEDGEPSELVRIYIMTSPILDGYHGELIARLLQELRPEDIRLYRPGGDRTRLKGVGFTPEEQREGQEIGWINPMKHRLPGQYASTAIDKEIQEIEATASSFPAEWGVGGFGTSISKPGGGEKEIPRFSQPVCHIPLAREPGEPSIALNQIGVRVFEVSHDAEERSYENWSLRDLAQHERRFVTGIKAGSNSLHRKIVEAIKEDREGFGFHVGEISDRIDESRIAIAEAISFLEEPRPLRRATWPGLHRDPESGRYAFHKIWFQETLKYPWPYDNYTELKRLLFGCLHAGYNTTDYEFVRRRIPEILIEKDIEIVEVIGDLIAGLKHHLMHRGQIIGNMNYTEQEVFAAELLGTGFYEVFEHRFEEFLQQRGVEEISQKELEKAIESSLVLLLFIVGNHDDWEREFGFTPGVVFRDKLISLLFLHCNRFLAERNLFTPQLDDIIRRKILELPEYNAEYIFPGNLPTMLLHPSMARALTTSLRAEAMLYFSKNQLTDGANFHTAIAVEKWDPNRGQCVMTQVGAMTPMTYFEHGKLKIIDFGPVFSVVRHKAGRIFMSRHQFFNKPTLQEPISKDTDINQLKERLQLLRVPQ